MAGFGEREVGRRRPFIGLGAVRGRSSGRRADPVRIPEMPEELRRALEERRAQQAAADVQHGKSVVRGLIVLAMVVLAVSLARAGLDRVFVHGWWRQW